MERRQAIVTGGTGGIGLETARGLVRAGFDVVILGRKRDAGTAAAADLLGDAASGQSVRYEQADLSSMADVRRVAAMLDRDPRPLDALVNNAGAQFSTRQITVDGFEKTLATNHFGMFLLTALLHHRLAAAPAARIVNVSSSIHAMAKLDLSDLDFAKSYSVVKSYAASKLANLLFTRELATRLAGTRILANCYNPGGVRSDFNRFLKLWWARPFTVTTAQGARTAIHLATSPEVTTSGGYYDNKARLKTPAPNARSADLARQLWDVSDAMTGRIWASALDAQADAA